MKIVDLSDQTFRDLSEPTDISIPSIASFYRFNVNLGKLNNLLGTEYRVDNNTLEIVDECNKREIHSDAASIYELIYNINYYDRQIRRYLGAGSIDVNILQEATSDGGTLRFVSRNLIAQSFIQMKKDAQAQLDKLVNYYKFSKGRASQVEGDDKNVQLTSNRIGANVIVSSQGGGIPNNTMP